MEDYSELENSFESRKEHKKERKLYQQKDRSKFKKTDQEKGGVAAPPENARHGRVITVGVGAILVQVGDEIVSSSLKGSLKHEITRDKTLVTVGDFVWVDERGQIAAIDKRYSCLSRSDNLHHRKQQILAANIDQVLIVASVDNPTLKPSLIDRYIIATERGGMKPVIIINKIDLIQDFTLINELEKVYTDLGIPFLKVSALHKVGIDELQALLQGKASVFSGQSGVGKTSLVNDLTGTHRKVGDIVQKTKKGSHTTTHAELIPLGDATFCIDTPGIKSFALWDITQEEITSYFSDLQQFAHQCKYLPCTHTHEPDCAVKQALEEGKLSLIRYNSYLTIRENHDQETKLR